MKINRFFIPALSAMICFGAAGCKGKSSTSSPSADNGTITAASGSILDTSDIFSNRDLQKTADTSGSTALSLTDSGDITITEEGVYVICGSAENATITVDAPDTAKVQLILDGITITNETTPAIYVASADKCFITLTDKDSSLTVSGTFAGDSADGVIYSKDDITLNGTGALYITAGDGNGITSNDDLKITGGTYNITASGHGLEANDRIAVNGGTFRISSQKDAIHCKNSDDDALGWVYIAGGTFDLNAASDGIDASSVVEIDDGNLSISGSEGIEATYVQINGGSITINASDDGINASGRSSAYASVVEFNGGYTKITVGQGDTDAVDSNGALIINGGTIDVTSTVSSFDYDTTAEFNGGTVIINGTEVSELPQPMMGPGGGRGGMHGSPPQGGAMPDDRRPRDGMGGGPRKAPPEGGAMPGKGAPPRGEAPQDTQTN